MVHSGVAPTHSGRFKTESGTKVSRKSKPNLCVFICCVSHRSSYEEWKKKTNKRISAAGEDDNEVSGADWKRRKGEQGEKVPVKQFKRQELKSRDQRRKELVTDMRHEAARERSLEKKHGGRQKGSFSKGGKREGRGEGKAKMKEKAKAVRREKQESKRSKHRR